MSLRHRLVADGVYTFGFRLANMFFAAVLGIVTARLLGPAGRGIYAIPMVDAGLVSSIFSGLSAATSYYLLRKGAGRHAVRAGLIGGALGVAVGGGAVAIIAFVSHTAWAALPAILSLPSVAALQFLYGYCIGTHRVRINTTVTVLSTGVLFVLMLTAFFIGGRVPASAITAWVVAGNLVGVGVIIWIVRDARTREGEPVALLQFIAYGARTGAVSLVSLLNYRADIYIVAIMTSHTSLGLYAIAVAAAETLLTVTQVTAMVATPHIASLEDRAAGDLTARAVRHNLIIATVCCVALALLAPLAVSLLYGAAFLPAVPSLRVLLIGVVGLSLGSPMSSYFTVRLGRPEVAFVLASASAAICIGVTLWLLPRIGLVGAAWGSTLAYVLGQAAAIVYFARTAGIPISDVIIPKGSDFVAYAKTVEHFALRFSGKAA